MLADSQHNRNHRNDVTKKRIYKYERSNKCRLKLIRLLSIELKTDYYLRNKINEQFYGHFKMCKCDMCGGTEHLELHHSGMQFFEMVDKAICDLKLPYHAKIDNYTNDEKDLITIYLLGLHINGNYQILCKKCHTLIHQNNVKRRVKAISNMSDIIEFLNSIQEDRLYKEQKIKLFELISLSYPSIRYVSANDINKFFEKYQVAFRVSDKDANGKRYVDKRRKLSNGEENNNRDKAYWKLISQ